MIKVHDECGSNLNEDCSKEAHDVINGLNWEKTQDCVRSTFTSPNKDDWTKQSVSNTAIDQDIEYWNRYGSSINPSIVINNSTYRGQLESQAVMNAICAGFKDPPKMCQKILDDDDLEDDLEVGIIYYDDGFHHWHLLVLMFVTTCCVVIGLCFWRRHTRREMRQTMQR